MLVEIEGEAHKKNFCAGADNVLNFRNDFIYCQSTLRNYFNISLVYIHDYHGDRLKFNNYYYYYHCINDDGNQMMIQIKHQTPTEMKPKKRNNHFVDPDSCKMHI